MKGTADLISIFFFSNHDNLHVDLLISVSMLLHSTKIQLNYSLLINLVMSICKYQQCMLHIDHHINLSHSHPAEQGAEGQEKLQPIVGHVSMVTDMVSGCQHSCFLLANLKMNSC